ncbi:MAG: WD40 repeat domain-containing protein, partial [Victivallaceae bacterium]
SPDCRELAGLSEDGSITIYETASGKLVKQLPEQYSDSLCWSADGKKIFAVSQDKKPSICRIDIASGSVEKLFPGDMPRLIQCYGKIAYKDEASIKLFSHEPGKPVTVWSNVPPKLKGYNISPCGKYLIYFNLKNPVLWTGS